jgi:hypothetical protein
MADRRLAGRGRASAVFQDDLVPDKSVGRALERRASEQAAEARRERADAVAAVVISLKHPDAAAQPGVPRAGRPAAHLAVSGQSACWAQDSPAGWEALDGQELAAAAQVLQELHLAPAAQDREAQRD